MASPDAEPQRQHTPTRPSLQQRKKGQARALFTFPKKNQHIVAAEGSGLTLFHAPLRMKRGDGCVLSLQLGWGSW